MQPAAPTILIVEDHEPTTTVLARLVAARGFNVITAASATEARQVAAKAAVGFVIADLGLSDGDGWELMAELHQQLGINGAAVSGFGQPADLERSRASGFIMHLVKPISIHQLDTLLSIARREIDESRPPFPGLG